MLLQSQLDAETAFYIDCEPVGGVNKEEMELDFHPDEALDHVVKIASGIAARLSDAVAESASMGRPPRRIDMDFSLKVDSNATVSVARSADGGQFRVKVCWAP